MEDDPGGPTATVTAHWRGWDGTDTVVSDVRPNTMVLGDRLFEPSNATHFSDYETRLVTDSSCQPATIPASYDYPLSDGDDGRATPAGSTTWNATGYVLSWSGSLPQRWPASQPVGT